MGETGDGDEGVHLSWGGWIEVPSHDLVHPKLILPYLLTRLEFESKL